MQFLFIDWPFNNEQVVASFIIALHLTKCCKRIDKNIWKLLPYWKRTMLRNWWTRTILVVNNKSCINKPRKPSIPICRHYNGNIKDQSQAVEFPLFSQLRNLCLMLKFSHVRIVRAVFKRLILSSSGFDFRAHYANLLFLKNIELSGMDL
jgi:hypothetical protein